MFDNGTRFAYNMLRLTIVGKTHGGEIILQESDGYVHYMPPYLVQRLLTLALD